MKNHKLTRSFYIQPTLTAAKELLGKYIVRKIGKKKLAGKIIETEAYIGPSDRASHAYLPPHQKFWCGGLPRKKFRPVLKSELRMLFGRKHKIKAGEFYRNFLRGGGKITPRNKAEYLIGGHIYIYLVYGMHWQLNISTYKEGKPECVLIRALNLGKLADGPGKVCRYLKLDKSFYGEDLTESKRIWLEDPALKQARCGASRGEKSEPPRIIAAKRIGIDYAGPYWASKKWRFFLKT